MTCTNQHVHATHGRPSNLTPKPTPTPLCLSVCLSDETNPSAASYETPSPGPPRTRLRENQTRTQPHSQPATQHSQPENKHPLRPAGRRAPLPSLCARVCMAWHDGWDGCGASACLSVVSMYHLSTSLSACLSVCLLSEVEAALRCVCAELEVGLSHVVLAALTDVLVLQREVVLQYLHRLSHTHTGQTGQTGWREGRI